MIEREDIETALTAALADPAGGGLQLHYQPVLDAASGALVGVEALIRWDRPGHGLLPPDSFIPIAEATALIIDLDCWVLAEATRQLVAWSAVAELADVPVAVNISGRHLLSRQLPDHIRAVLDQTGIDPHRLSIEITETVLLTDLVAAAAELDAVRALGVKVAIDDFGTGYTSLAHLQQLPIDTIKIDRSFISQLNVRRGSSLVRMVTDLGHAIDINIVAEGVETDEEMSASAGDGRRPPPGLSAQPAPHPAALSAWVHETRGSGAVSRARRLGRVVDDALAHGGRHRFQLRVRLQLVEDVLRVVPHGVEAQTELLGDLLVDQSGGDQPEDLELAGREIRAQPSMGGSKLAQQRRQIARRSDRLAVVGRDDGLEQDVDRVLLLDEA